MATRSHYFDEFYFVERLRLESLFFCLLVAKQER